MSKKLKISIRIGGCGYLDTSHSSNTYLNSRTDKIQMTVCLNFSTNGCLPYT